MPEDSYQAKYISPFYFLLFSFFFLIITLSIHHYMNSQVFVVMLDDLELGVVKDACEIEHFVDELTEKCSNLYGMELKFGEKLTLVKELRPENRPEPELVQDKIRQKASFRADAYLIEVDGKPLVPVSNEADLEVVVNSLKEKFLSVVDDDYKKSGFIGSAKIIEVALSSDLTLKEQAVEPAEILSAEEVAELLLSKSDNQKAPGGFSASYSNSFQDASFIFQESSEVPTLLYTERDMSPALSLKPADQLKVQVKTVEELVLTESVPYETEYVYDEEMSYVEEEVTEPGMEGEKELVYHLVRKNGVEVERELISEEIVAEPRVQVVTRGLSKPPALGTGSFAWPVQGEGMIYNGYSSWHRAIDIHIDHGTPVLAADDGLVAYSGYGSGQGNYLVLYHGKYWTLYLHNSKHLVSEGDRVSRGQPIARVGATGRAFGAHLHFEVRIDDGTGRWDSYDQHEAVNPMQFFRR